MSTAKRSKSRRHWSARTFKQTSRTEYSDGKQYSLHGYCSECFGDMAYYTPQPGSCVAGGFHHYNSHTKAKALGLWGVR